MDFSDELNAAISIAKKTAKEVMRIYNSDFSHSRKRDNSYISEADHKAQEMILEGLKGFGYGFVAEETRKMDMQQKRVWTIDPIDGTRHFVKKTGDFAIMIGLLENARPIMGVIYAPVHKKLYFAEKGKGAYLYPDKRLKVSETSKFSEYTQLISGNMTKVRMSMQLAEKLGIKNFTNRGSFGLKTCMIAAGEAEMFSACYYSYGKWDTAPAQIIVEEAGGKMINLNGERLRYDTPNRRLPKGIIVCNGKNVKRIVEACN